MSGEMNYLRRSAQQVGMSETRRIGSGWTVPVDGVVNAHVRLFAMLVLTCSAVSACVGLQGGDDHDGAGTAGASADPAEFCDAMEHLIVLLEPTESSTPSETKATFDEAAVWFEQARTSAPEEIADDVGVYADAFGAYTLFLGEVDYRLDVVFSTDEGRDLAIDTSHTLTPAIVGHVTGECGLSFGNEE